MTSLSGYQFSGRIGIFFFFLILAAACRSVPAKRAEAGKALFLEQRIALLKKNTSALHSFTAKGFFYYKDPKTEMNLVARIVHDPEQQFYRITFRGNLDNALWADILVKQGEVHLYFPLQKIMYHASLQGFDLYPFTRIHVMMEELLQLASLTPFLIRDARAVQSTYSTQGFVLYRENATRQQKVFFSSKGLVITGSHVFQEKRLRAILQYSLYKVVNNIPLPFKSTLTVPQAGMTAVLWLNQVLPGSGALPVDSVLTPDPGTTVREM